MKKRVKHKKKLRFICYDKRMTKDTVIAGAIEVLDRFKPRSIFLYGSRARTDFMPDSDYEIGVIFDESAYVNRSEIHKAISSPEVKAYPFKTQQLMDGTFDTPFQRAIYLRELALGGRTLKGERIIEKMTPPQITTFDLVQRIRFDMGYALAAVLSMRSGDDKTCKEEFSKSCLFGIRCLEILEYREFSIGYDAIYEVAAKVIKEPEYLRVVEAAFALRRKDSDVPSDIVFKNISLLNSIDHKITASFGEYGNQVLV